MAEGTKMTGKGRAFELLRVELLAANKRAAAAPHSQKPMNAATAKFNRIVIEISVLFICRAKVASTTGEKEFRYWIIRVILKAPADTVPSYGFELAFHSIRNIFLGSTCFEMRLWTSSSESSVLRVNLS